MDAALAKMTVERADVRIAIVELFEIAQVGADALRRHGRILPPFPILLLARDVRGGAQTRLADFPKLLLPLAIIKNFHSGRARLASQMTHQAPGLVIAFGTRFPAEFNQQESFAVGQHFQMIGLQMLLAKVHNELVVQRFEADRAVETDLRDVIARAKNVRITEDKQR